MKNSTQLTGYLQPLIAYMRKHAIVLCIMLFSVLAGYLLVLTNKLSTMAPDQTSVDTQLNSVPRPKIDEKVVKTIRSLEDRNIDTQAIFDNARDNPFSE